jgi:hypothetical protein
MAIYCFECGVEVSDSQKVVRNGRVFCSQTHAANIRQTAAPPQVKLTTQPNPAQNPPRPAAAAQPAATAPKAAANPPAAPGRITGKP